MKQTAITKSANGESCTIRLPGVCCGDNSTTVYAHINGIRYGHGVGHKNLDIHGAYACFNCHQAIDRRDYLNLDRDFVKLSHLEGVLETQLILIKKGLIKC